MLTKSAFNTNEKKNPRHVYVRGKKMLFIHMCWYYDVSLFRHYVKMQYYSWCTFFSKAICLLRSIINLCLKHQWNIRSFCGNINSPEQIHFQHSMKDMRFFLPLHFNISSNFGNFRCITRALFPLKFTYSLRFNSIMRAQMSWALPLYVCTCFLLISSCFCSTQIQPIVIKYPETKFISFVFHNSVSINIATFGFQRKYYAHTVDSSLPSSMQSTSRPQKWNFPNGHHSIVKRYLEHSY